MILFYSFIFRQESVDKTNSACYRTLWVSWKALYPAWRRYTSGKWSCG